MTENLKEGGVVNKPITNTLNTQEEIFNTKINKNNFSFCFETLLNYSLIKMDYNCSCNKKLEELNLKKEKITKFFKKVKNIIPLEKMEEILLALPKNDTDIILNNILESNRPKIMKLLEERKNYVYNLAPSQKKIDELAELIIFEDIVIRINDPKTPKLEAYKLIKKYIKTNLVWENTPSSLARKNSKLISEKISLLLNDEEIIL